VPRLAGEWRWDRVARREGVGIPRRDNVGELGMQLTERHHQYWQKNLRITALLLGIWFFVTFVVGYFARDLNFNFFGWPFSFWVAAQGALIVYVVIIWYYAHYMNKLDKEYGVEEEE
jgi:putative solute:sodium symporter small subunit